MIPLKLYMRNFMCYREQALDLRGVHLACLTGNNGHGKSAILDAMTWTLWGHSRVGARRDDELIHVGQAEMEAEFEFVLLGGTIEGSECASSDTRYRVIRKRTRRKRGQSSLEFQGWDAVTDRFRPLSEPTIAQTQRKINELLRMDYDTFINSAFLLQGRADEFTIKRPAERKRVLGDILGLQIYDRYETLAKQVVQERKKRGDQLLATVEQIDQELAREPEYRDATIKAESELAQIRKGHQQAKTQHEEAQFQLRDAKAAQQQMYDVTRNVAASQTKIDQINKDLASHQERLRILKVALSEESETESKFHTYLEAAAKNEIMNADLAKSASFKEQQHNLEQRAAAIYHDLDMARHSAAEVVNQLEQKATPLGHKAIQQEIHIALAHLDKRAIEKDRVYAEIQRLSIDTATMRSDSAKDQEISKQIEDKIALLSTTGKLSEKHACCPLCDQVLPESIRSSLHASFEKQLKEARKAHEEHVAQANKNQKQIDEFTDIIVEIDQDLHQRINWQRKETDLARTIRESKEAKNLLPGAQDTLLEIQTKLESEAYAPELHTALFDIKQQLTDLGYSTDAHSQIQAVLNNLRHVEACMQTLQEARLDIGPTQLAIRHILQRHAEAESQLAKKQKQAMTLCKITDQIPDLEQQALNTWQVLETAHDREQQANLQLGAARNKVDYCSDLKQQRVRQLKKERTLRKEQSIYQELQRAFGKNGVQAMLIESAIPDIEQEANRLLTRMTRGRMHVRFETQRDTKKGNTIETLDIHITDELGTRSYETYSGGERYRINFAIRVALSKLLTRRSGAQLQMLVIDEGFGTQDIEGRDGLIDAINAIQNDFACVLVITHIEELKDIFDVRIQVVKTADGSEIAVV